MTVPLARTIRTVLTVRVGLRGIRTGPLDTTEHVHRCLSKHFVVG